MISSKFMFYGQKSGLSCSKLNELVSKVTLKFLSGNMANTLIFFAVLHCKRYSHFAAKISTTFAKGTHIFAAKISTYLKIP